MQPWQKSIGVAPTRCWPDVPGVPELRGRCTAVAVDRLVVPVPKNTALRWAVSASYASLPQTQKGQAATPSIADTQQSQKDLQMALLDN